MNGDVKLGNCVSIVFRLVSVSYQLVICSADLGLCAELEDEEDSKTSMAGSR